MLKALALRHNMLADMNRVSPWSAWTPSVLCSEHTSWTFSLRQEEEAENENLTKAENSNVSAAVHSVMWIMRLELPMTMGRLIQHNSSSPKTSKTRRSFKLALETCDFQVQFLSVLSVQCRLGCATLQFSALFLRNSASRQQLVKHMCNASVHAATRNFRFKKFAIFRLVIQFNLFTCSYWLTKLGVFVVAFYSVQWHLVRDAILYLLIRNSMRDTSKWGIAWVEVVSAIRLLSNWGNREFDFFHIYLAQI